MLFLTGFAIAIIFLLRRAIGPLGEQPPGHPPGPIHHRGSISPPSRRRSRAGRMPDHARGAACRRGSTSLPLRLSRSVRRLPGRPRDAVSGCANPRRSSHRSCAALRRGRRDNRGGIPYKGATPSNLSRSTLYIRQANPWFRAARAQRLR
jgi:hypothetical protein